jgi:general secretion pathway protein L
MSRLVIALPLQAATAQTALNYVISNDAVHVDRIGKARAEALPRLAQPGDERIALVPPGMLSWHLTSLPEGVAPGSTRMRAVLAGLLEDELLDAPERLHFALPSKLQTGGPQWVVACDRRWLAMACQTLEAAGQPLTRVVPEWALPTDADAPLQLHVMGSADEPQLVVCGPGQVGVLPLDAGATDWLLPPPGSAETGGAALAPVRVPVPVISAEPALRDLASQTLGRPALSLPQGERWLRAANTPWDLSRHLQMRRHAQRLRLAWLQAPRWRAARWAALALISVNLVGLNAQAWLSQQQHTAQTKRMTQVLTSTFPNVKTVVDAPLQMARETRLLEQARAVPAAADLDVMLGALSQTLPPERKPQALGFNGAQLSLKGLSLSAAEGTTLTSALQARGYRFSPGQRPGEWLMQPTAASAPGAAP